MNFKKMFATVLSTVVIAGSMAVGSVSATYYCYSSGSIYVGTSDKSEKWVGNVFIGDDAVTDVYYSVYDGWFGSKVETHNQCTSNLYTHSAGVSSNGKSSWSSEGQLANRYSGKVKTKGYATIMAMVEN